MTGSNETTGWTLPNVVFRVGETVPNIARFSDVKRGRGIQRRVVMTADQAESTVALDGQVLA